MWVKLSAEELAQVKAERAASNRLLRKFAAILFGLLVVVVFSFKVGRESGEAKGRIARDEEVPKRLPFALVGGVIAALVVYWFDLSRVALHKFLVCPKCEARKDDDGLLECSCGGRFIQMEDLKWVENAKSK